MFKKPKKKKKANTAAIHKKACRDYMKKFADEHDGRVYCEIPGCPNPNKSFPPHSPHHIMSAARNPKHPELHNDLNLILLCHDHHTALEENRLPELHELLVKERGLKELFKRS